jgi:hypothetical protein
LESIDILVKKPDGKKTIVMNSTRMEDGYLVEYWKEMDAINLRKLSRSNWLVKNVCNIRSKQFSERVRLIGIRAYYDPLTIRKVLVEILKKKRLWIRK